MVTTEVFDDGVHVDASKVEDTEHTTYTEMDNGDGTRHYQGALGEFDYDPTQFEIQRVNIPNEMNGETLDHNGYMDVLRYVGPETDGSKIHIPEGLTNMDLMFMNTNIKSAPKIPSSVESMFASFASCQQLKTADITIPPKVKSGEFMFADCKNLEQGLNVVPGTMQNANYMFAACSQLKNTPKIGRGVQQGECMFAGCESLTKEPNVPRSMVEYHNMTVGCTGIDAAKDAQAAKKLEKDREKYEKKLNRTSLMSTIGSGFGFAMQVHAMRQSGYSMLMAPFMVHSMRKNGQLSRSFTGGVAANMMTKGGMQGMIGLKLANQSAKNEVKKQQKNMQRMQSWDNAHAAGQGTSKDLQAQTKANKDLKRGLFMRMTQAGSQEKNMYRQMYDQHYTLRENMMQKLDSANALDSKSKQAMSKWYQQQMSSAANYYAEGVRSIQNSTMTSAQKQQAMQGLREVSRMQMEPLMQSAEKMQRNYQIFNTGDLRNIRSITVEMPSEKAKGADFVQRVSLNRQDMNLSMRDAIMQAAQRNAVAQTQKAHTGTDRGAQAEQKFGHMGSAGTQQSQSDYDFV